MEEETIETVCFDTEGQVAVSCLDPADTLLLLSACDSFISGCFTFETGAFTAERGPDMEDFMESEGL